MGKPKTGAERRRRFRENRSRIDYFPSPEANAILSLWRTRWTIAENAWIGDSKLLDRIITEWARVTGNTNSEVEFPDTVKKGKG